MMPNDTPTETHEERVERENAELAAIWQEGRDAQRTRTRQYYQNPMEEGTYGHEVWEMGWYGKMPENGRFLGDAKPQP